MSARPVLAAIIAGRSARRHDEIVGNASRAAQGFARLRLGDSEAVALLLRNGFAFFEASLGANLAGAYAVPINWRADVDTVGYILRDCSARVLVAHAGLLATFAAAVPDGVEILVVDEAEDGCDAPRHHARLGLGTPWPDWLAGHDPIAHPAEQTRPAVIYTSGSTGRPKGVRRAAATQGPPSPKALAVYGLDDACAKTVLVTGPLFHSVPNANARLAMQVGADIVLQERFDAEEMLQIVESRRVTHVHVVPSMMVRLVKLPEAVRARYDVSSLRHVAHGAAHCPKAVKRALIDWWGPVVHEYYGSTETGLLTLQRPEDALSKPGSVGRALPGVTLHILDPDGRALPAGETGDVYASSATLHDFSYIGQQERRAAIGRGDLVTAGDVGFLDADGCLFLRGRRTEVVVRAGREFHPAELEALVLDMPGVGDCAMIAVSGDGEAMLHLFVEPTDGDAPDPQAIAEVLHDAAAIPRGALRIEISRALPREDSGKIFKDRLAPR